MSRIIVDNRSKADDCYALELVKAVISSGRVSNNGKQYCYYTTFLGGADGNRYGVSTDLNKASDRFTIVDDRNA